MDPVSSLLLIAALIAASAFFSVTELSVAASRRYLADALPVAPSPMHLFGSYPTTQATFAQTRLVLADPTGRPSLAEVLATRSPTTTFLPPLIPTTLLG